MKISGFTLIRNGVKYSYPFKEAILSVLPLCDEFVVNVGESEDETLDVVESIGSERIRIVRSRWDRNLRESGKLLSVETNRALQECAGDWCFYIQADEVLHEKYIPVAAAAMEKHLRNSEVEGLRFRYKHFYGSYDYYQDNYRKWYVREVRIIRNGRNIFSWADAMGFRHADGSLIRAVDIRAEIYHYGHVRPPRAMADKTVSMHKLYHDDKEVAELESTFKLYDDLGNLKKFKETHPAVMHDRIEATNWHFDAKLDEQYPDWFRAILIFLHPVTKRIGRLIGLKVV